MSHRRSARELIRAHREGEKISSLQVAGHPDEELLTAEIQFSPFDLIAAKILRPYQREWIADVLRSQTGRVAVLGGRQIGKDFILAGFVSAFRACVIPHHTVNVVSSTDHHAKQMILDIRRWLDLLAPLFGASIEKGRDSKKEVALSNGSVIFSHASTPRALVGQRGDVILNEIGIIPHAEELYQAAYPIYTGARDNEKPAILMLVSNASPRGSFWHRFWTDPERSGWTDIVATWSDCMRSMGRSDLWIAERRARYVADLGLPAFLQWYECVWRAASEGYLPEGLLRSHTYVEIPPEVYLRGSSLYIGYDVGRHMDPASFARVIRDQEGRMWVLPTETAKDMKYRVQRDRIQSIMNEYQSAYRIGTSKVLIDSTGSGDEPAERAEELWPGVAEGFRFSAQSKWELFSRLRATLESGRLYLPACDLDLRMELEAITLEARGQGPDKVVLPRNASGHCDRAVAVALAVYAATDPTAGYWGAL